MYRCSNNISQANSLFHSPHYSNGYLGTPLSCAAFHGHDHIVKYLFSHDVYCNGSYSELKVFTQPIATFIQYLVIGSYSFCMQFLLLHLIQLSPLLLATQQGHLKVVKILLGHPRIDVTLTNEVGYNALAEAIVKGYRQVVKVFKE